MPRLPPVMTMVALMLRGEKLVERLLRCARRAASVARAHAPAAPGPGGISRRRSSARRCAAGRLGIERRGPDSLGPEPRPESQRLGGRAAMLRATSILALVFGAFLAVAELARNWGAWQWWPFWLVDFIAAGLLILGAISALGRSPRGPVLLAGAWGFTSAMFYMSFWSHIESFDQPATGNVSQG